MKKIFLFCLIVFTILNYFGYLESKRKAIFHIPKLIQHKSHLFLRTLPESVLLNKNIVIQIAMAL